MKLESITIENFRCFDRLTVELHPELTVLIAPNGAGKTALLDAARIAVWPFVKAFDLGGQAGKSATIQIEDVRMVKRPNNSMESVIPSKVISTGSWYDNAPNTIWMQTRKQIKPNSNTLYDSATREMIKFGENLQNQVRDVDIKAPVNLPLVAYLGTGRLWYQGRHTSIAKDKMLDRGTYSRTWGYRNCLSALSNYKQFEEWYAWVYRSYWEKQITNNEKGIPLGTEGQNFLDTIKVIKRAVNEVIEKETGWKDIAYSSSLGQQIILSHPTHGDMPLSMLSDGLRNTIVMVADIAFRCVKLNPHYGVEAALKTAGIVMIDEVDMFLHPAWQQTIIGSLQRAFPLIQFIVTTHSPQVLTTVPNECIRIIKDGEVHSAPKGTKGAESSRALKRIFGVDVRPSQDENAILLKSYLDLVYADKWSASDAIVKRQKLDEIFGNEEPALTEADLYIENRKWELEIEKDK